MVVVCVYTCVYVYISAHAHTCVLKIAPLEEEVKGCCLCQGVSWMDS